MAQRVNFLSQAEIIPLRHAVLRKNQPIETCFYPEDAVDGCFHLGIKNEVGEVICIASFYPERHPELNAEFAYRLRGMATKEALQGQGLGSEVIYASFEIILKKAREMNHTSPLLWCNARTSACGFYEKLGFQKTGDEFDIPNIGPHYVMSITL